MNKAISILKISAPTDMWFGDPCYVYPAERWDDFCEVFDKHPGTKANIYEENGHRFLAMDTAYGDGDYGLSVYDDFKGVVFVDSGTLALIPVDLVREWGGDLSCGIVVPDLQGKVIADPDSCSWSGIIECDTDTDNHHDLDDWDEDDDWAEAA